MDQPTVELVQLHKAALEALVQGDLSAASRAAGLELTSYFLDEDSRWLWALRLEQLNTDPASAYWVTRAARLAPAGPVVGRAGFHGPPDAAGMVEVGYGVDPPQRRRGYARAMLRALLAWAEAEPAVRRVRASIRPDNVASLATIRGFGFDQVGEQMDERDGLELLFEREISP